MRRLAVMAALLVALTGCGGESSPSAEPSSPAPASSSTPAAPAPSPTRAKEAPRPPLRGCYRLDYRQALSPTAANDPVDCSRTHTAATYYVGRLSTVVDGHLLAVDSRRVQDQVAADCPARFAAAVGGTTEQRRLSMLRAVWFTPTVEAFDAGQDWYRCDAIALAADERLGAITGPIRGLLDRADARERYAMCSKGEPGTAAFARVFCSSPHSWRALRTVDIPGRAYPGEAAAKSAGETPCQEAARAVAANALDYQWGYEAPTKDQWAEGRHYGICWAPD